MCFIIWGFPGGSVVKNLPTNVGDTGDMSSIPGVRRIPWRREWLPIPLVLPGKSHGQRSLAGYSPCGHKKSDTTERLSTHTFHCLNLFICSSTPRDFAVLFLFPWPSAHILEDKCWRAFQARWKNENICIIYICIYIYIIIRVYI